MLLVPVAHADMSLMPLPSSVQAGTGSLAVTPRFSVAFEGYREKRLDEAVVRMIRRLGKKTGLPMGPGLAKTPAEATLVVKCSRASKPGCKTSAKTNRTALQLRPNAPR